MQQTPPEPDDDDTLAEALAAELEARAMRDPALRRAILARLRSADPESWKPAAELTLEELAQRHETDRFTLRRIARKALTKLRHTPELRSLKP